MFNDWIHRAADLKNDFENGDPFPLIIIDDFLDTVTAVGLLSEFPSADIMPKSRDYMFGDKHELSSLREQGPLSKAYFDALTGDEFRQFLRQLTGRDLFVDPAFHGGGFHQSGDGGFLDTHVDFNMHPMHDDWLRSLNILLYLNQDWADDYGGSLLLKANPDDQPRAIKPIFNRAVIMVTDDHTFHGFKRMSLPPHVTRKSIAAYAYEKVAPGSIVARTTGWAPEQSGPLKKVLARHYNTAVQMKTRLFGSGTAKHR